MTAPTPPAPANPFAGVDFSDHRGGVFYVVNGVRVHEDDLTPAEAATITAEPAYTNDATLVALASAPSPSLTTPSVTSA